MVLSNYNVSRVSCKRSIVRRLAARSQGQLPEAGRATRAADDRRGVNFLCVTLSEARAASVVEGPTVHGQIPSALRQAQRDKTRRRFDEFDVTEMKIILVTLSGAPLRRLRTGSGAQSKGRRCMARSRRRFDELRYCLESQAGTAIFGPAGSLRSW